MSSGASEPVREASFSQSDAGENRRTLDQREPSRGYARMRPALMQATVGGDAETTTRQQPTGQDVDHLGHPLLVTGSMRPARARGTPGGALEYNQFI